jgi:hypothetical protein
MSVLNRLAYGLGRRDEIPNQELAAKKDRKGIQEIAEDLKVIFSYLLDHLAGCRPKEVPQHAEKTLPAVTSANKIDFIKVLEKRMEDLSGSGLPRTKKVVKQAKQL